MRLTITIYAIITGAVSLTGAAFLPYILEYNFGEFLNSFGIDDLTGQAAFTVFKRMWPIYFIGIYLSGLTLYCGIMLLLKKEHAVKLWLMICVIGILLSIVMYVVYKKEYGYVLIAWEILVFILSWKVFISKEVTLAVSDT